MPELVPRIDCPIDLFLAQERKIQELTRRINAAKGVQAKGESARALQEEVEVLLHCSAFDEGNNHCVNCQAISSARGRMATLILRTEEVLNRVPGIGESVPTRHGSRGD